jgi:hypothetical protein
LRARRARWGYSLANEQGATVRILVLLLAALISQVARADLFTAQLAYKKGDFQAAAKDYRALAELGNPMSFQTQIEAKVFATQDALSEAIGLSKGQVAKMLKAAQLMRQPSVAGLFVDSPRCRSSRPTRWRRCSSDRAPRK